MRPNTVTRGYHPQRRTTGGAGEATAAAVRSRNTLTGDRAYRSSTPSVNPRSFRPRRTRQVYEYEAVETCCLYCCRPHQHRRARLHGRGHYCHNTTEVFTAAYAWNSYGHRKRSLPCPHVTTISTFSASRGQLLESLISRFDGGSDEGAAWCWRPGGCPVK